MSSTVLTWLAIVCVVIAVGSLSVAMAYCFIGLARALRDGESVHIESAWGGFGGGVGGWRFSTPLTHFVLAVLFGGMLTFVVVTAVDWAKAPPKNHTSAGQPTDSVRHDTTTTRAGVDAVGKRQNPADTSRRRNVGADSATKR